MNYTVTEGNYLRFGLQSVKDGVIFTFAGEKEDVCAVILYDRSLKVAGRVEAPAAFCRGAVRSIYIHGLKADHLLYNYEIPMHQRLQEEKSGMTREGQNVIS